MIGMRLDDGQVERLREGAGGQVLRDPLELLEKLSVLVPAPRTHLLRYHGVLAPHAAWRAWIVPRSPEDAGPEASALAASEPARPLSSPAPSRLSWEASRKRVFAVDVRHCPRCGGRRRIVGVHTR